MYILQKQLENIKKILVPQKAVVLFGPRRCGKTTLLQKLIETVKDDILFVSGEDIIVQEYLNSQSIEKLKNFVGEKKFIIIDEAQKVKNIGINIKLILDHIPGIKVLATGSSSFDLAQNVGEPLTGRKITLRMFPLAQLEIGAVENRAQTESLLQERLIFGSYPEIVTAESSEKKILYLKEIVNSYLFKDILELDGIRNSAKIARLLQLLVFQIGKEVSQTELGKQLGMSKNTVDRYLDILEKSFIIFKLMGFSRNLRKEISKANRYYFYDTGIRNALINNFNLLSIRDDVGMLWENYIIAERIKKLEYLNIQTNNYFWRTYDRQEIDMVEESGGELRGYEIKWSDKKVKTPALWLSGYKNAKFKVISRSNYLEFIT